jgi:TPR repeat protein
MLNEDVFSEFCKGISQWFYTRQAISPKPHIIREQVARALTGRGSNTLLQQLRTNGGMPLDAGVCQTISAYFRDNGLPGLPTNLAQWPLPAKFGLTPDERLDLWLEACQEALASGRINATAFDSFSAVEPYIVPTGDGGWFVCRSSPVEAVLCTQVLAPAKVTVQAGNNTLRDDILRQRHPRETLFHTGLRALRSRDHETALLRFLEAAGQQHVHAHFNAAWMLEQGLGAPRDDHAAFCHYEIAAAMGSMLAHHNLGMTFLEGTMAKARDIDQAKHHFRIAAEGGITASLSHLGDLTYSHPAGPEDVETGLSLLLQAASEKDAHSVNRLGTIHEAEATPADLAQALELYKLAYALSAGSGNVTPAYNLGRCYLHGQGTQRDPIRARELFMEASAGGDMDAAFNLAMMHYDGQAGERDYAAAAAMARTAVGQQHPQAENLLGYLHLHGLGVPVDAVRAAELFAHAAASGVLEGQFNLAILYSNGLGVKMDRKRAIELLQQAAVQGHPKAKQIANEMAEVQA